MAIKHRLQLDNTLGVVDSDYYYSDNEGHIFIKVTNDSKKDVGDKRLVVNAGDRFVQAIFLPYGITYELHTMTGRPISEMAGWAQPVANKCCRAGMKPALLSKPNEMEAKHGYITVFSPEVQRISEVSDTISD